MLVLLPLVLKRFDPAEISVFFLFSILITFQLFIAGSFGNTFARIISYVLAGGTLEEIKSSHDAWGRKSVDGLPKSVDRDLLARLLASMDRTFNFLGGVGVPSLLVFGFIFLAKPIGATSEPWQAWFAWSIVSIVTLFVVKSLKYLAFLQGANQLAIEQRWSAIFALGGLLSGVGSLLLGGGLLALVATNQLWQFASFLRLRWLSNRILANTIGSLPQRRYCPEVMQIIWPAAWRTTIGTTSMTLTTMFGSLWFAQFLPEKPLAELLFGARVMNIISELCRAPFYSLLPAINNLRMKGTIETIVTMAKRGMRRTYATFIVLFLSAPIVAFYILPIVQSQIQFPPTDFWLLLGAATLIERCAAMHVNISMTTNKIIIHWLAGWTMVISVISMVALTPSCGSYAYPIGILIATCSFLFWNALRFSLTSINQSAWEFEKDVFAPAALFHTIGSVFLYCWSKA